MNININKPSNALASFVNLTNGALFFAGSADESTLAIKRPHFVINGQRYNCIRLKNGEFDWVDIDSKVIVPKSYEFSVDV